MDAYVSPYMKKVNGVWEIYLTDSIDSYWGINLEWLITIFQELRREGATTAKLIINSPGGDAQQALAMYNYMLTSDIKLEGVVLGIAASAAGIILQACQTRTMYKSSFVMVHRVSVGYFEGGDADQLKGIAQITELYENQCKNIFISRTKQPEDVVNSWFDGNDHYFTADDALANGLCDSIIEDTNSLQNIGKIAFTNGLKSVWESFKKIQLHNSLDTPKSDNRMFKVKTLARLGLKSEASTEAIEEKVEAVIDENAETKAQLEAKKKELEETQAKLKVFEDAEAAKAEAEATEATTAIENAHTNKIIDAPIKTVLSNMVKAGNAKEALTLLSSYKPNTAPRKMANELNNEKGGTRNEPQQQPQTFAQNIAQKFKNQE